MDNQMQEAGLAPTSPALGFLNCNVGKLKPAVAALQMIIGIKAGLVILKIWAIVSAHYYDDAFVCSKHTPGPQGVQEPCNLKWDLYEACSQTSHSGKVWGGLGRGGLGRKEEQREHLGGRVEGGWAGEPIKGKSLP